MRLKFRAAGQRTGCRPAIRVRNRKGEIIMDLAVNQDTISINNPVFDGTADHPVECDVLLPDYCPDIARILQTGAEAVTDSKTLEAGVLTVNGNLSIKIIYIPENSSSIRCFTYESAFSHSFEAGEAEGKAVSKVKMHVNYVNFRPIGPRRVQVKASVGIAAKITSQKQETVLTGCDDNRVETLKKQIKANTLVAAAEKPFTMNEDLEVEYGKPPIAAIISSRAVAVCSDYKVISNKVIAKGEVLLHTVYSADAEDAHLEVLQHSIPISQIIDLDGADEDCMCEVALAVNDVKVEAAAGVDGENNGLSAQITINAMVSARREQEFEIIQDAYSPVFEMNIERKAVNFEYVSEVIHANEMLKQPLDISGSNAGALTYCAAKAENPAVKIEGKKLTVEGELKVSMLAQDTGGGPLCMEKPMPFKLEQELKKPVKGGHCEPEITVVSAEGTLSSADKLDLRLELAVSAVVYGISGESAVSDMALDESRMKQCNKKTLTIYYADKGESIWEIAKMYNTSMNAVKQENELENDTLPDRRMLLIPKKRCANN